MVAAEIDSYLAALDEPKRSTLAHVRASILAAAPDAEQGMAYGAPAFALRGTTIAGFAAFKNHLSYLPHSGSVLPALAAELTGYTCTTGSLHFAVDEPLPAAVVHALVAARLRELGLRP